MTQVNFYTLGNDAADARLQFACRLTEKARELGHQIYIQTSSIEVAKQLDDLLWQFKPASFIPHEVVTDKAATGSGVSISVNPAPPEFSDLLINLTESVCANHQQFARINEIIGADTDSIEAGRQRYRFYRDAGVTLETFKI
jgi:DNA polymerase III subunit chi